MLGTLTARQGPIFIQRTVLAALAWGQTLPPPAQHEKAGVLINYLDNQSLQGLPLVTTRWRSGISSQLQGPVAYQVIPDPFEFSTLLPF